MAIDFDAIRKKLNQLSGVNSKRRAMCFQCDQCRDPDRKLGHFPIRVATLIAPDPKSD